MPEVTLRRILVQGQGRRPYFLFGGRPLVLPNLWLEELSVRENTLDSYARDVLKVYRCAIEHEIDLIRGFSSPKGFTRATLKRFATALTTKSDGQTASQSTCKRRLEATRSFFEFGFRFFLETRELTAVEMDVVDKTSQRQRRQLATLVEKKLNGAPSLVQTKSFTAEEMDLIWSVLHPASELNPFASHEVRVRNYCLVRAAIPTLARRSELVLLELDDVNLGINPTITIKQPSFGNRMKRRDGADLKTGTRVVPIEKDLAEALDYYIEEVRDKLLRKGRPCRNVFVSAKDGRRLANQTVHAICAALSRVPEIAALGKGFHPHMLRTSATNAASELLGANAASHERHELLAYMGGWSDASRMPNYYAAASIRRRLQHVLNKRQVR